MSSPPFWQSQLHQKKKSGKKFAVSTSCRPLGVWFTKSSYFSCTSYPEFLAVCCVPFVFLIRKRNFLMRKQKVFYLWYIFFEFQCFWKQVYTGTRVLLILQTVWKRTDCLYSNVLDLINDNLSSVWSLWGSVTLSVSFSIDQAHHSWWIECSLLLGKKSINFTQFFIKNCSSLRSFSWIFIFLITF